MHECNYKCNIKTNKNSMTHRGTGEEALLDSLRSFKVAGEFRESKLAWCIPPLGIPVLVAWAFAVLFAILNCNKLITIILWLIILFVYAYGYILYLSLIHICRCRRSTLCRSRWSPYH
eukprot:TRINITY_DN13027_c0_g1_i13.p2 TRINITY_DN13027_c0_g1~~TRINITY_DN13027_c0_g1_i13.p2  ORF type:complete len:118 (+),score=14.86 TRINITY_DN13027_c0_g1_i13:125-478(+)